MKKLLSLLLAGTVMTAALAGCTVIDASKEEEAPPEEEVILQAEAATVAVSAVIVARDDVSEDDVYAFVSTIYDNADALANVHSAAEELSPTLGASVTSVPYHPGAAKYFEEQGQKVSSVKSNAGNGRSSSLIFGVGDPSGTYYAFGSKLADYVSKNSDVSVSIEESGGSQDNIEALIDGEIQLGFVQSDVMSYAYTGERLFESAVEGFSVVAALYQEPVQIVTTNPDIQSVEDLKGKAVSIGAIGSGVYFNAVDILNAYGLDEENDIHKARVNFTESQEHLNDGTLDAAFITAGAPTNAILELAESRPVYLVSIDAEHINALQSSSPYYVDCVIPAGTYN